MDGEFEHYGVKGMHWGIIRTPEQLGHAPKEQRKAQTKELKENRKSWRVHRREVTALQRNVVSRERMSDVDRENVSKAEERYMKASKKIAIGKIGRLNKQMAIRRAEEKLDKALEQSEPNERRRRQAHQQLEKSIDDFNKFVDKMNNQYGKENVKQLNPKTVSTGMLWWKRNYAQGIKTGINMANIPIKGDAVTAGIVNQIDEQVRQELMEERLNDYDRKRYA